MAGFTITSPTNRVVLDRRREGKAAFTVINQTGHRVRAQAYIVPVGSTDSSWLTVVGSAERELFIDATEPVLVEVVVPMNVPAGQYPFRLDVASVDLPNEEWGRGPVVTFDCAEPEKPPEPETEPPGYIETAGGALAGAVAALVIILLEVTPVLGLLALLVGVTGGVFVLLRVRDFPDPWLTAVPTGVLALFVVVPIAWIAMMGGGFGGVLGLLVAVIIVALAARAFARWRLVGHL